MRFKLLVGILILILFSCNKDDSKVFLKGRLLEDCSGNPISNQELRLYDNYQPGVGGSTIGEKQEELLETVVTDADGRFKFTGKGYTDRKTKVIYSSSIRMPDGKILANGQLGKGRGSISDYDSNQETGDLYRDGITVDMIMNISTHNSNGVYYDSVRVICYNLGLNQIISDSISNWFQITIPSIFVQTKDFYTDTENTPDYPENGGYFIPSFNFHFFKSGFESALEIDKKLWFQHCISGAPTYVVY